jgi:DNA repair photolyase
MKTQIFAAMSDFILPVNVIKGRGVATRLAHRFARDAREAFDDGWHSLDETMDRSGAAVPTQVIFEDVKSVITRNHSPDIHFDLSINPYRGCEHGCSYCYARPTHSYLNLSPGLDFETKIIAKRNIADVLRRELAARRYVPSLLNIGSATDCYQPVERELRLTRSVIEVLQETRHPFSLITKGSGVERDLDLITPMAALGLAAVYVTMTTLDAKLARQMEPRAAAPHRRLRTIKALADAGIPVGVSVAPQIPFINPDMEQVLEAAWAAGARRAFWRWSPTGTTRPRSTSPGWTGQTGPRGKLVLVTAISPTPAGRGQDHHHRRPGRRAEPHRQARRHCAARTLARAGVRHEGRGGRRRLCAGGADGGHQPALHRRLQRHRAGPQPAGGAGRQPHPPRQRAGPRCAAHRVAPRHGHERPGAALDRGRRSAGRATAFRARMVSTSSWPPRSWRSSAWRPPGKDLKERLGNIIVGYTRDQAPVRAAT